MFANFCLVPRRYRGIYAIGNLLGLPPDPRIAARKLRRKRCRIAAVCTTCTALIVGMFLAFGMPLVSLYSFCRCVFLTERSAVGLLLSPSLCIEYEKRGRRKKIRAL